MCSYAYMLFSKYARESSVDAITIELAKDFNIKSNNSGNAESYETIFF